MFNENNQPRDIKPGQHLKCGLQEWASGRNPLRDKASLKGQVPRENRNKSTRLSGNLGGSPSGGPGGDGNDPSGSDFSGDEEDGGRSSPPTNEEEEVEGSQPLPQVKTRETCHSKNYNIPYQWSHTAELDLYKNRGTLRVTKYLRAIHEKYHHMIDDYVGERLKSNSGIKMPKVPEPKTYNSKDDIEIFDRWLISLLRWFRVNQYCGLD